MDGVWEKNKLRFLDKSDLMDANFITTSPKVLNFLPDSNNNFFIPNPTDESFEMLNNYSNKSCIFDVFFALSHGVHRGILKRGKIDERDKFINRLIEITPNVIVDVFGSAIGKHARSAIGGSGLPMNFAIEIEGELEIE